MSDKIYYWTYCGLPLCLGDGLPIHAKTPDELSMEDLLKIPGYENLKQNALKKESMNQNRFLTTEWPK